MKERIIFLIPVYNDWVSLNKLIEALHAVLNKEEAYHFSFFVVNDGSTCLQPVLSSYSLNILHLKRNIGHQKAIAIGLAYIKDNILCDKVIIMDSDGEDRPEDVPKLLTESGQNPEKIIFAERKSRQEENSFLFFYWLYKFAFKLLTGKRISFGNFLILPKTALDKIVYYSEIWSHLAGGILKTKFSFDAVITHRGKRYADTSKMSFTNLLMHGLGAIAVFIEVIATRLLFFSLALIGISLLIIVLLLAIRAFTSLAIPGWTSTVVAAMLIVLLQSFLLSLFTIFLYLSFQSQRKFIPANHYKDFTGEVEKIV